MVETGDKSRPAATAMKDVLQAEVEAREAVATARAQAAGIVETARTRATALEALAERRIRKINASTDGARERINREAEREREVRLARLAEVWQVNIDQTALESAVGEFARRLINGEQGDLRES